MSSEVELSGADHRLTPWTVLLILPVLGLGLLVVRPEFDVAWEHHPSHFWLVLVSAGVNVALAYVTNLAAGRYRDARVVLISLAFLASAGFLGLHALATPGVLLPGSNIGFVIATPVGLLIASVFAVTSVTALGGPRAASILRRRPLILAALVGLMIVWGVFSLADLPPLRGVLPATEAAGPLAVLAVAGVALYAVAAWRTLEFYRRRGGGALVLAIGVALTLLGEAMLAVALSHNWHLSWWEWHILMLVAFAAIGLGARSEYRRSGSLAGPFGGLYLEATLAQIDRWNARAISAVAAAEERGEPVKQVLDQLRREGATSDEVALLEQAARELRRLDAAFRPYLPSLVAQRLRREPTVTRLGGEERDVSVLFADLAGFTTFSETRSPTEVIAMLNDYWAAVVPAIDAAGGVIEHFAGDGVMAIFNAGGDQSDHARRASRAGLSIVEAGRPLSTAHPGWPIFRVGISTGRAVVGNVGVEGRRSFAAIGDTTNTAARLMGAGEPGQVVIAKATWDALGTERDGVALGPTRVKGKSASVEAWIVRAVP